MKVLKLIEVDEFQSYYILIKIIQKNWTRKTEKDLISLIFDIAQ